MKKFVMRIMMVLYIFLGCFSRHVLIAVAAQKGWVQNADGAWTYVKNNGSLAKGYCKYTDGDKKHYFFWCPGYIDEDGNEHETGTLAWDKIIIRKKTGEPMYVASKEGPLEENYELEYNGYIYKSDSRGVLKKTKTPVPPTPQKDTEEMDFTGAGTGSVAAFSSQRQESGNLWIDGESHPKTVKQGHFFPIKGIIHSDGVIRSVFAEIVDEDDNQMHAVSITVDQSDYDLSGDVDDAMVFNDLAPGSYVYRVSATDSFGYKSWLIYDEFEIESKGGDGGVSNISSIYQHQQTHTDCTVTSVLMMLRSRAMRDGRDWSSLTLSGLKSKYWGNSGMAWGGTYAGYSFTSDDASIRNNYVGSGVGQVRYDNLVSALSRHPEGVVLYIYDAANSSKAHAVFVSRIQNGVVYILDPYGPSSEIPLSSCSTFNKNFGLYTQESILRADGTLDGRSFLWYCNN